MCYCNFMLDCTFSPSYLKAIKPASCLTLVPLLHVFIFLTFYCEIKLHLWEFLKIITSSALLWSNFCFLAWIIAWYHCAQWWNSCNILTENFAFCPRRECGVIGPIFCPWAHCSLYRFIQKSHLQTRRIINWRKFPG